MTEKFYGGRDFAVDSDTSEEEDDSEESDSYASESGSDIKIESMNRGEKK